MTAVREEQAQRVRALRDEGLLQREIAEQVGVGRSYVSDLLRDPFGELARQRKESYRGECEICGGPTDGSNGPAKAPKLCAICLPGTLKIWTREKVIETIQEWARRRGRPPKANEWIRSIIDPDGYKFPPRTAVYVSQEGSTAPFSMWADAIASAGFPRPRRGDYPRKRREIMSSTREYVVMEEDSEGRLSIVGETVAGTNQEAVENVVTSAGRYLSIAKASFQRFDLAPKLVASKVPARSQAGEI